MSLPTIPNVIFSTRAANPQIGSEFHRDIVAESPGVPDKARSLFGRCADITLSARKWEEPVIFIFRSVEPGLWLFCRAVSLGLYRKSSHQLLIHGIVLNRSHLDAVEGNPFLFDRVGGSGVFKSKHPGDGRQLRQIELPDAMATATQGTNRERFEQLTKMLADAPGFGLMFDGVRQGRPVSHEIPQPSEDWAEWLLLHLHPFDRAEVSFHTWAVDGTSGDYDLSLLPPTDRNRSTNCGSERPSALAVATGKVRDKLGTRRYLDLLDDYFLTYRSNRDAPPVPDGEALLGMRYALGEHLEDDEREIVDHLELRGLRRPARAAEKLGGIWSRQGFEVFSQRFERLVEIYPEVMPGQLGELRPYIGGDLRRTWSALELVRRKGSAEIGEKRLLALWRVLVPPDRCEELLKFFSDPSIAERVRRPLSDYIKSAIEEYLVSSEGVETPLDRLPYWTPWEAWAARHGVSKAALGDMEDLVARHTTRPSVAAARFRQLFDLALKRDEPAFAYRLVFQRELPALAEVSSRTQQERLEELIHGLVDVDPGSLDHPQLQSRHTALRFFLTRPPTELLEEDTTGKTLLSAIRWALIFGTQTKERWSASKVLARLPATEPSRFVVLAQPELDEDWMEMLLSNDLLYPEVDVQSGPSETWRLDFVRCFRLTWWHWSHGNPRQEAPDRSLEVRLARLFEVGLRLGGVTRELLQRVIDESVPEYLHTDARSLSDRFLYIYQEA